MCLKAIMCGFAAVWMMVFTNVVAHATPHEQNREYGGGDKGPVVFSYQQHADLGQLVCEDCHATDGSGLFEPQRYEFTLEQHNKGQLCWACHNGKQAPRSCDSCHY
ncbi:hypothetical protein FLM48_02360 [Shewanella sp. Scap07]|uniref:c(7)-type cytochrome triheme domain-containing protein n=1 Tax=Shewanella sp. Scap07 TaxID=2589987 RepID=UPI0015BC6517|nr:c(7)-type cytochrome triheme domain-containing protein [Shewanella sp. Scap07]QLE84025.1 hypothetical protein FLM48_02360 [Shewanella sp. Scap07]